MSASNCPKVGIDKIGSLKNENAQWLIVGTVMIIIQVTKKFSEWKQAHVGMEP